MRKWIVAVLSLGLVSALAAEADDRVDLKPDLTEANAVLAILDKRARHEQVDDSDWQRLFASTPYRRLKEREASMRRPIGDAEFKDFVVTLDARRLELQETLTAWSKADLLAAAQRSLSYLPADATIRASVYAVIKPQTNSFVFQTSTDPAIFLYLDPKVSQAQFENTVAHELHHIGLSSLDEKYEQRIQALPENARKAARWMGALGEGMAVLAAAGSADVPPLAAYPQRDQKDWELNYERAEADLDALNQFFLDVIHGDIRGDAVQHVGSTFFGYRGPWYTVGYLMASTIEKEFGRAALIETYADARRFVVKYNEAAALQNAKGGRRLAMFSAEVLEAGGAKTPTDGPKN